MSRENTEIIEVKVGSKSDAKVIGNNLVSSTLAGQSVVIKTVGVSALGVALKAIIIANRKLEARKKAIVVLPNFFDAAWEEGEKPTGILLKCLDITC